MRKYRIKFNFSIISYIIRNNKILFLFFLISYIIALIFSVIYAFKFNSGLQYISFYNIPIMNYLKGNINIFSFWFFTLLTLILMVICLSLCFIKKPFYILGLIIFSYFAYTQYLIYLSIILTYGFLNTFIIIIPQIIMLSIQLLFIVLYIISFRNSCRYQMNFKNITNSSLNYLLIILCLQILNTILVGLLKNFVIVLVF